MNLELLWPECYVQRRAQQDSFCLSYHKRLHVQRLWKLLFQPQTVTPQSSTPRPNTLLGVDFRSILGRFLVSFGQHDKHRKHNKASTPKKTGGFVRNGQSTVGGPKWTKMDVFRPKWTKMDHFGLANAKIRFGIRPFWPKWSLGPFWTILVQYAFQQYRGHSLVCGWNKNAAYMVFRGRSSKLIDWCASRVRLKELWRLWTWTCWCELHCYLSYTTQESHIDPWPQYLWNVPQYITISSAIVCKSMPSSWVEVIYAPPFYITSRFRVGPRFGSLLSQFGGGTVRAVPVFGSYGEGFRFVFRFFSFRFRFGSWARLQRKWKENPWM